MTDAGHQNKMQEEQGSDFQNILQTTYPRSLGIFTPKEDIKGAEFGPAEDLCKILFLFLFFEERKVLLY